MSCFCIAFLVVSLFRFLNLISGTHTSKDAEPELRRSHRLSAHLPAEGGGAKGFYPCLVTALPVGGFSGSGCGGGGGGGSGRGEGVESLTSLGPKTHLSVRRGSPYGA